MTAPFDVAPLLAPGTPPPAVKWNGFPKYNFVGGHNDAKQVPVQALIDAATAVLKREGATLATYGLNSGPLGYRPLREFLSGKLKGHAGIDCTADEILITSGSLQGLDLVNTLLLAKGDTILIEKETYGGALTRLAKFGVNIVGIPLDNDGMRMDALKAKLAELKAKGVTPKYIYTIPTVQNPTGSIMPEARRREMIALAREYGTMIFEDECYSDLIWNGKRPRSIYSLAGGDGVIFVGSFSKSIAPALRVGYIVAKWARARSSRWCWRSSAPGISTTTCPGSTRHSPTSCRCCARHWPSSSARPPSSAIRRAASISGSSCPTTSTR
jgi:2-aminoadipate transaminase